MNADRAGMIRNVIISGFDYPETERRAEKLATRFDMLHYSTIYVPEPVYREDIMTCHIRRYEDDSFRYIRRREADVIYARTYLDACRNFDWMRSEGVIVVEDEDGDGNNPRFPQARARKFLEIQEEMGYVHAIIHCQSKPSVV